MTDLPNTDLLDSAYVFPSGREGSRKVFPGKQQYQGKDVIGSYKTKEDIVNGYKDTLSQWYEVVESLGSKFYDVGVPIYGLLQTIYNFRVDDHGDYSHNLLTQLRQLKEIERGIYRVSHSFQTVYASLFTNTDDSKWMTDIVSLQPVLRSGEIKLERQQGIDELTTSVYFRCPTGILSKSVIDQIAPLDVEYLTITEAYLSCVDKTQFKFDRRKSSIKFRESQNYHLSRDLQNGKEIYKISSSTDEHTDEGWEGWDEAEDGSWNLPIAWWIEVSPELKSDLNAKMTYDTDKKHGDILSETERAHSRLGKLNNRLNKQNKTVNGITSYLGKRGRFVLELNSTNVKKGYYN